LTLPCAVRELGLGDLRSMQVFACRVASCVGVGDVIALYGDLGTGKTSFARFFIQSFLGDDVEVPSPTFTLMQGYDVSNFTIYHYDLYRVECLRDVEELGVSDAFDDGVSLIEWPEVAASLLPRDCLALHLSFDGNVGRLVRMEGYGDWERRIEKI